jgi:hypothetical protein
MKEDLNFLLFKKTFIRKGSTEVKPLFRFQSELANEIVSLAPFYQEKTSESIRPYINQVLKPGDSYYQKPISADLRNAIIMAIKSRLNEDDPFFQSIEETFDTAYNLLKQKPEEKNTEVYETEFHELLKWQEISNKTSVFNRDPSEAKWVRNTEDDDIKNILNLTIENLLKNYRGTQKEICSGIFEKKDPEPIQTLDNQYGYRYYVPSFSTAKEVWQGFFEFILYEIFQPEFKSLPIVDLFESSIKLIRLFNTSNPFRFIKVFKVDEYLASIPLVYFESTSGVLYSDQFQHEALFSLVLKGEALNSVSRITGEDLEFWKEKVYYPLTWSKSKSDSFNAEEIKFDDVLVHILRTCNRQKITQKSV